MLETRPTVNKQLINGKKMIFVFIYIRLSRLQKHRNMA